MFFHICEVGIAYSAYAGIMPCEYPNTKDRIKLNITDRKLKLGSILFTVQEHL
jgi:hypothetical protein